MRIGIIGFSTYLKKVYWPYLKTEQHIQIVAVCDISPEKDFINDVILQGENSSPTYFTDINSMIDTVELDAVIISTPHMLHFEQAKSCLQKKLHVYIDKPIACNYNDANILVNLAQSNHLHIAVGNQRRYELPYESAKKLIHQKDFGEIYFINYLFANSTWGDYKKIWRGNPELSGGGALMDIGYLALDTLLWMIEKPVFDVFAIATNSKEMEVETTVALVAQFFPNIPANITISYDAPFNSVQEELAIYGSKKALFIRRFQPLKGKKPPIIIELSGNGEIQQYEFDSLPDNSRPLKDFINSIKNNTTSQSNGESHQHTIQIIDACYESIRLHRNIHIISSSFR